MSQYFVYVFFLTTLINTFGLPSPNYIYQELDGNLLSMEIQFSLFIENSAGVVFYGIDSHTKLLITLEKKSSQTKMVLQLNKLTKTMFMKDLCGCSDCSGTFIQFVLQLNQSQIIVTCVSTSHLIKLTDLAKSYDQFNGYPIPLLYRKSVKKIFIWMGNIGPYDGYTSMHYLPLKNQLFGCVDEFSVDGTILKLKKIESKLKPFCPKIYNETACNETGCRKSSLSYNINNCSFPNINIRYCKKNTLPYNGSSQIKLNESSEKSIITRLEWRQSNLSNFCLMEMKMRDASSITFYISKSFELKIIKQNGSNFYQFKKLQGLSINTPIVLIVYFSNSQITVKLAANDQLYTYASPFHTLPKVINIGFLSVNTLCETFTGILDFQYSIQQYNSTSTSKTNRSTLNTKISSSNTKISSSNTKISSSNKKISSSNTKILTIQSYQTTLKSIPRKLQTDSYLQVSANVLIMVGSGIFFIFIVLLIIFHVIIRKEIKSRIVKMAPIEVYPANCATNTTLLNIYENEIIHMRKRDSQGYEVISTPTRDSGAYEIIPN